jgi:uncharacterized protein (TIGR02266 family)
LELDTDSETMTLLSSTDDRQGTVSWESVIEFIQASVEETGSKRVRNYARSRLAVQVHYRTSDKTAVQTVTGEIGGGGVFIETGTPARLGDALKMDFVLPDNPNLPITATGKVAWIRPQSERYVFYSGMGVQFTDIAEDARKRLVSLIKSLEQARGVK